MAIKEQAMTEHDTHHSQHLATLQPTRQRQKKNIQHPMTQTGHSPPAVGTLGIWLGLEVRIARAEHTHWLKMPVRTLCPVMVGCRRRLYQWSQSESVWSGNWSLRQAARVRKTRKKMSETSKAPVYALKARVRNQVACRTFRVEGSAFSVRHLEGYF